MFVGLLGDTKTGCGQYDQGGICVIAFGLGDLAFVVF